MGFQLWFKNFQWACCFNLGWKAILEMGKCSETSWFFVNIGNDQKASIDRAEGAGVYCLMSSETGNVVLVYVGPKINSYLQCQNESYVCKFLGFCQDVHSSILNFYSPYCLALMHCYAQSLKSLRRHCTLSPITSVCWECTGCSILFLSRSAGEKEGRVRNPLCKWLLGPGTILWPFCNLFYVPPKHWNGTCITLHPLYMHFIHRMEALDVNTLRISCTFYHSQLKSCGLIWHE